MAHGVRAACVVRDAGVRGASCTAGSGGSGGASGGRAAVQLAHRAHSHW